MKNGFKRMPSDPCLFTISIPRQRLIDTASDEQAPNGAEISVKTTNSAEYGSWPQEEQKESVESDKTPMETLILGTYVDDLIYSGSSDLILNWFDKMLAQRFEINPTDTGNVHHALGARIRQDLDKGTLTMDQSSAIQLLAERFKLTDTKPNARNCTPATIEPLPKQNEITADFPYLSAVGSLLHIAGLTRPDISYAVGAVARHGAAFGDVHVKAVKRIIQYLYHTKSYGIKYRMDVGDNGPMTKIQEAVMFQSGRPPPMTTAGQERLRNDPYQIYCDADFAGDTTKRSTSGRITFLNCGPISWSSQLMKLQALSTTESEIYSATEAIKDATFLKLHLTSLGVRDDSPIPVFEDNSACTTMGTSHLKTYNKARHYATRLNFLQEKVHDGTVELIPTPTKEQIADALTKSLGREDFVRFRDIMVSDVYN
jgi:hypothetical protein